ncbi:S100P-binding protein isoform X2 [Tiliqua scincoides]|uniref:S100P-binding protein isoform X2 n=1 Tax=Tiliqua scincoides TaxID=71010 RepID=UPI003461D3E8
MQKGAEGDRRQESGSIMALNGFCSRNFHLRGSLKVTFSNDSVSRNKRPLQDFQDGDQALQLDAKRQCWEGLCGSPPPSQKAVPQPALLSSSPSSRAASQACALTASRFKDDSDLDATLLEPSDGEEPDSPLGLSPEAEAKLLEDDPDDDVDPFPPFVIFGAKAKQLEISRLPMAPETAQRQSISGCLEKTIRAEPLLLAGPSDLCSDNPACRDSAVTPERGSHLHGGPQDSSSPAFPEAVPAEAASMSPEKEGKSSVLVDEEATQAGKDVLAVGRLTAGESTSVTAKGSTKEQASIVQELGGERVGHPPGESEGELDPANLLREAATLRLDSACCQSEDCVENPSTNRPKSPTRPKQQIRINQADLEGSMKSYINTVFAHIHCNPVLAAGPSSYLPESDGAVFLLRASVAEELRDGTATHNFPSSDLASAVSPH